MKFGFFAFLAMLASCPALAAESKKAPTAAQRSDKATAKAPKPEKSTETLPEAPAIPSLASTLPPAEKKTSKLKKTGSAEVMIAFFDKDHSTCNVQVDGKGLIENQGILMGFRMKRKGRMVLHGRVTKKLSDTLTVISFQDVTPKRCDSLIGRKVVGIDETKSIEDLPGAILPGLSIQASGGALASSGTGFYLLDATQKLQFPLSLVYEAGVSLHPGVLADSQLTFLRAFGVFFTYAQAQSRTPFVLPDASSALFKYNKITAGAKFLYPLFSNRIVIESSVSFLDRVSFLATEKDPGTYELNLMRSVTLTGSSVQGGLNYVAKDAFVLGVFGGTVLSDSARLSSLDKSKTSEIELKNATGPESERGKFKATELSNEPLLKSPSRNMLGFRMLFAIHEFGIELKYVIEDYSGRLVFQDETNSPVIEREFHLSVQKAMLGVSAAL